MRIVASRVTEHHGATPGAGNARRAWPERRGFVLELVDEAGRIGLGEASPLPGFSPDTAEEAEAALHALESRWPWQGETLPDGRLPPSAAFALESAFYDLLGQRRGLPLYRVVQDGPAARYPLSLAALVASLAEGEAAWTRGIRTFKVKAGADFAAELKLLRALRRRFGGALALRVDVNGAWTTAEARERLATLAEVGPEFVEEPCARMEELGSSPVPLARDESLQRDPLPALAGCENGPTTACRALVLKPAALGGFRRCLALAGAAPAAAAVVSHLFDGPIALAAAKHLAFALAGRQGEPLAAGLDRHAGLAAWPAPSEPSLPGATLPPPETPGLGPIRWRTST